MKTKVGIIFGGCSSEYDVSLVSVTSVIKNINKEKYDVVLIGITKQGDFYLYQGDIEKIEKNEWKDDKSCKKITISTNRSDIIVDERLDVYDLGSADGMLMSDIKITGTVPDMNIYSGIEKLEDYKKRIYSFIWEIIDK